VGPFVQQTPKTTWREEKPDWLMSSWTQITWRAERLNKPDGDGGLHQQRTIKHRGLNYRTTSVKSCYLCGTRMTQPNGSEQAQRYPNRQEGNQWQQVQRQVQVNTPEVTEDGSNQVSSQSLLVQLQVQKNFTACRPNSKERTTWHSVRRLSCKWPIKTQEIMLPLYSQVTAATPARNTG